MPTLLDRSREERRRRTRAAIVEAAMKLMETDPKPSASQIATAAGVSRRTVYMYFPTLEQLWLDATLGAMAKAPVDKALKVSAKSADPLASIDALAAAMTAQADKTLPMGRALIGLTAQERDSQQTAGVHSRGYRRVQWIENALGPFTKHLSRRQRERLISALAVVLGFEALIVLRDIRGLTPKQERDVTTWAARALVRAALEETASPEKR